MKDTDLLFGIMASLGKPEYSIACLVRLTVPFDLTESNLRTVLHRMVKRGVLSVRKEGKQAFYSFAGKGWRIASNVAQSFREPDWTGWDDEWWGFVFSLPHDKSGERYSIRRKLESYRFALLYPGFWIRPFRPVEELEKHFSGVLAGGYCRMIRFRFTPPISGDEVRKTWNIYPVGEELRRVREELTVSREKISRMTPVEAFQEKMILGARVVQTLFLDPLLPEIYLPEDWQGNRLRREFQEWIRLISLKSRAFEEEEIKEEE